jgi:hypothetical protein
MIYRYLSEVGNNYDGEVGMSGVRESALGSLENKLKLAILDLKKERDSVKAPASGSFQDRVQFFQNRASNANSAKIKELEVKVALRRDWLVLQGAVADSEGNVNWDRTRRVVEYDSTYQKIGMTLVHFAGGRLFQHQACTRPLDTKHMVTAFSGPGKAIYVMGRTGNIHLSSHSVGYRHHSSLLAGTSVAGAGELQVEDGRLKWISNKSGHYAPSVVHLVQTLHQLQKRGVPMFFRVKLVPDNQEFALLANSSTRWNSVNRITNSPSSPRTCSTWTRRPWENTVGAGAMRASVPECTRSMRVYRCRISRCASG